jgi:hypothetical protein
MARSKAPKDIRRRREESRTKAQSKELPKKYPWWKWLLGTLGLISSIVSIAGVLALIPRLSLVVSDSLEPRFPMKTVFSISNDGLLPVHDIDVACGIDKLAIEGGGGISGIGFEFPDSRASILSPSQQMSLPCDRVVGLGRPVNTKIAKMTITVDYRPDFVWWHRHIEFPVEASQKNDGTWMWRRLPN